MKLGFPSHEFDDAVAAVCHGSVSDEQARALNELLRTDPAARDEYLFRVELHSRLASNPDLFVVTTPQVGKSPDRLSDYPQKVVPFRPSRHGRRQVLRWAAALAACVALLASGWWGWRVWQQDERKGATSKPASCISRHGKFS